MNNCIFCKMVAKEIPANIIHENDSIIAITSLENHPLIIPKSHVRDIYALSDIDGAEVMKEAIKISKAVKKALKCDGINLVQSNEAAAGQDVFHFHLHIKPRWINDNVEFNWETKTVDKQIREQTTEKIREELNQL